MVGYNLGYKEIMSIPLDEIVDFLDDAETLYQAKLKSMGIEIIHIRA